MRWKSESTDFLGYLCGSSEAWNDRLGLPREDSWLHVRLMENDGRVAAFNLKMY